jgi:hypothetical protein
MPPSRPTTAELLEAVREFRERDVLPVLSADSRFQCRIAINVLAMVRRELELRPALDAAERERLATLLDPCLRSVTFDPRGRVEGLGGCRSIPTLARRDPTDEG